MSNDIDEIQAKIRALYQSIDSGAVEVPFALRAVVYASYAADYLEAARILNELETQGRHRLLMPWYQLVGQALELAMKACLAVKDIDPPHTHDLVALSKRVQAEGFSLGVEHAAALLVHLNHGYFEDLATRDRFVARYGGGVSKTVPDHARLATLCTHLLAQARERNPMLRVLPESDIGVNTASSPSVAV